MHRKIAAFVAAMLMNVCGVASADIVYNVYMTDGVETLQGTITTNGASGALTATDFVSWSLSASGAVALSDVGPGAAVCPGGCGVEVVGDTMQFVGDAQNFLILIQTTVPIAVLVFFDEAVAIEAATGQTAFILNTAPYVIGAVGTVPEPPSAALAGIAMACLGVACIRGRRRLSASDRKSRAA